MRMIKKILLISLICLLTSYSYGNNKGGNSGNSSSGNSGNSSSGNSGNSSSGNSGNNSSGNSGNSSNGKTDSITGINSGKSQISSIEKNTSKTNNSSNQNTENHGRKVSTYNQIAKSLGLNANVGTHLANFGTPQETGITDLQNKITSTSNIIDIKSLEIQFSKEAVSNFEIELSDINSKVNLLETELSNTELTNEELTKINNEISILETQREELIEQVELQEENIKITEIDLINAIDNLAVYKVELANTIKEVETKTGVTGWATVNLDTNGDGKITEADIKN